MDETDKTILQILQSHGRISNADLGRQINLSSPAIHARIKRLEEAGFIYKYTALLDREKLGYSLICFINVQLTSHHFEQMTHFEKYVSELPEVLECYHLTGDYDFLLKVVLRDRKDLEQFVIKRLSSVRELSRINTSLVISEIKTTTELPMA